MFEERIYRELVEDSELVNAIVVEKESDLQILSSAAFESEDTLKEIRKIISDYIAGHKRFQESLEPIEQDFKADPIVQHMIEASRDAEVGPMAAVAGTVSEYLGKEVRKYSDEVVIENGGDIYMDCGCDKRVLVYAGESVLSNKLSIKITQEMMPVGICTSAGTVGHSLSFGKADAVVVISKDTPLADATATSLCNRVKSSDDISRAIEFGKNINGILGILIIIGDKLGVWGEIELA